MSNVKIAKNNDIAKKEQLKNLTRVRFLYAIETPYLLSSGAIDISVIAECMRRGEIIPVHIVVNDSKTNIKKYYDIAKERLDKDTYIAVDEFIKECGKNLEPLYKKYEMFQSASEIIKNIMYKYRDDLMMQIYEQYLYSVP